jgi:hypothetical protein
MFVCCECCVLSGIGLCDGLITRPEESYRLWRVVVCHQETSKTRRLKPATGLCKYITTVGCNARKTNKIIFTCFVWMSEQKAFTFLYSINSMVFVTQMKCVYCEVRIESWNIIQVTCSFKFLTSLDLLCSWKKWWCLLAWKKFLWLLLVICNGHLSKQLIRFHKDEKTVNVYLESCL